MGRCVTAAPRRGCMGRFLLQLLLTYDFELLPTLGGPWEAAVATPILAAEDEDGLSQAPEARRPG